MLLQDMSWVDAKKQFAKNGLVILPTGSCESHGPHMPLGTDMYIATEIARQLGDKLDCIVAPAVNYGYCPWHQDFNGTITIDHEILYPLYYSIAKELVKWGATHIIFLNGHGGNTSSLDRLTMTLRVEFNTLSMVVDWWKLAGALNPRFIDKGHGGYVETSAMLYFYPELVDMTKARKVDFKNLLPTIETAGIYAFNYKGITNSVRVKTSDISEYGNYGADPRISTSEFGEEEIKTVLDYLEDFSREFVKMKI